MQHIGFPNEYNDYQQHQFNNRGISDTNSLKWNIKRTPFRGYLYFSLQQSLYYRYWYRDTDNIEKGNTVVIYRISRKQLTPDPYSMQSIIVLIHI